MADIVDDSASIGVSLEGKPPTPPPVQFGGIVMLLLAMGVGAGALYYGTKK